MTTIPTRRERAERALQLRAKGLTASEIARVLGVSRSYAASLYGDPDGSKERARKDSYRSPCPRCGTPMDGSNGRTGTPQRCRPCKNEDQHANAVWTREAIIAAIQRWARVHGRPPFSVRDWGNAATWEDADGEFQTPAFSTVYGFATTPTGRRIPRPFPKWADAIEAAGFPRPTPHRLDPIYHGRKTELLA